MEKLHPEATEASQFLNTLHDFHRQRGTDFKFAPKVCGQEIDLHALYKVVTAAGGAGKINEKPERWYEISHQMRFPDRCPNSTLVLRQLYQRYLSSYEKVTFLGEDPDMEVEESGEMTSGSFRSSRTSSRGGGASSSAIVIQVPMSYNRQQHEVTDGQRVNYGLSSQFAPPASPFERLCFSLQSGLPNEETFALNVCTLLANGGRNTMQLNKAPPRLLDLLIAQAGLTGDDSTLPEMLEESWRNCEARRMQRFWQEHVDPTVGKCLGVEPLPKYEKIVEERMRRDTVELIAEGGFMASKEEIIDEDDLFNLDSEVSPRDAEAQRVLRIALILHNLSFEEANAQILAQNQGFLRMMMLSSLSRWPSLRQVGLDTLSNIAPNLQLNVHDDVCCRSLLRLTVDGILKSEDRGLVTRCLDILAHLAQCENNQETLVAELDGALFERLLELLTVHDVLLIIHSLETLFALTELGDGICERLVAVKNAIRIIISMLSLDPIAYGPSAQRGMRIVEHFDPLLPPVAPREGGGHIQVQIITPASPAQQGLRPAQPGASIQVSQPSVASTPPNVPQVGGGAASSAANHEVSVSETEALAIAWIRSHCELTPGASVGRQELYADYVTFCSKAGRRSVLSGQHFSTCIKNIFPQSTLKVTQVPTGPNQQVGQVWQYDNLRRRTVPTPVTIAHAITTTVATQLSATALSTPNPMSSSSSSPISSSTATTTTTIKDGGGGGAAAFSKASSSAAVAVSAAPAQEIGAGSILKAQLSAPRQCAVAITAATLPSDEDKKSTNTTSAATSSSSSSNLIKSLLASKVSRNILKQAELTKSTVPEATISNRIVSSESTPATPISNTTISNIALTPHMNGVAEEASTPAVNSVGSEVKKVTVKTTTAPTVTLTAPTVTAVTAKTLVVAATPTLSAAEGLAARGVPPAKETPAKSNGNHEGISTIKVYKSSPLLNGLLDRGTPSVPVVKAVIVNGDGIDDKKLNGDKAAIEIRKRRLTFSSEDSNSQEGQQHSEKDQSASKNSTKMLHNGTSEENFTSNNNDQAKRIKLDLPPQQEPAVKQTNGDVKQQQQQQPQQQPSPEDDKTQDEKPAEAPREAKEACETPQDNNNIKTNNNNNNTNNNNKSSDEVVEGAKQSNEEKTSEKDQEKSKDEKTTKVLRYYCEWKGCEKSFLQSRQVLLHAVGEHVGLKTSSAGEPMSSERAKEEMFCEWGISGEKKSCDNMARRRLSLCTHVQERHCSENNLQIQAIRRQQISQFGTASLSAPPQPPPHPGYAPDAAVHAIRRHANTFYQYKDAADEKEHSVTKSVRLTAALILRNLAKYAPECRTQLVQYEHQLAQVAMSALESSRTIAQCLADIHASQDSATKTMAVMEQNLLFQEETRPRYA